MPHADRIFRLAFRTFLGLPDPTQFYASADYVRTRWLPYVDFYLLATIYAGLGENDEAFRLLEKCYEQPSASMPYLRIDPSWCGMRSDTRYADLLRRIGLPQRGSILSQASRAS